MRKITISAVLILASVSVYAAADNLFEQSGEYLWKGKFQEAVKGYEQFAEDNAEHHLAPAALFNAANIVLMEINDTETAMKHYQQIVNDYPGTKWAAESCRRMAEIAQAEGNRLKTAEFCRLGLKNCAGEGFEMPDSWLEDMAGRCGESLAALNNPELMAETYTEIIEFMPHGEIRARTLYQLAEALEAVGREQEAASKIADLIYNYPYSTIISEAMETKRELVGEEFPWDALSELSRARRVASEGDYKGACEILEGIIGAHPGTGFCENAEFGLISVRTFITNDFEAAIDEMRDYLDKYPDGIRAREAEERMQIWADVLNLLDQIAENPENHELRERLGFIFLRNGMFPQAEEHFLTAAQSPDTDLAYYGLGHVYSRTQELVKAAENFERYLKKHPDEGGIFNRVGYLYINMQQYDKALACFSKYLELEPDNPNSHDSYAECLMNMGRIEEAIAEYKRALEIDPNFTNPYFMLGEIYMSREDSTAALKYYRQYLELDPRGYLSVRARANVDSLGNE